MSINRVMAYHDSLTNKYRVSAYNSQGYGVFGYFDAKTRFANAANADSFLQALAEEYQLTKRVEESDEFGRPIITYQK